jgi:hypothetical protein
MRAQHRMLSKRVVRLQAIIAALEKEMEALQMGISLTPEERLELFGKSHDEYYKEAEERWGETEAWMESKRKAVPADAPGSG